MKFWQRAYYSILLLFLLCISIAIYSLSVRSYRTNLERQMEYALGESYFIMTSMEKERAAAEANGRAVTMEAVFQPYAAYYQSLCRPSIMGKRNMPGRRRFMARPVRDVLKCRNADRCRQDI